MLQISEIFHCDTGDVAHFKHSQRSICHHTHHFRDVHSVKHCQQTADAPKHEKTDPAPVPAHGSVQGNCVAEMEAKPQINCMIMSAVEWQQSDKTGLIWC